ncbi:TetR family transcriptional regulator [Rhodococcus ruber]|uniref:TetR family transcriptional regulator n=1 Tax=Rhodococcus TaxID=1827 RepID=UPI001E378B5D|nr:TetR family transcriptional regulator [Rhodococcus ruber]MCD2129564.1 TetR family transcriptional regulator [Rhodococcus ruber]MCZ4506056.1 TetR family transcriptional regulator [Rhodococcus ruber]MCZ4533157.1 TetR family transcriptional regulator [Rhodococcus ruber]MCZ4623576.1 TetR family transcriptional regulator [Rhodococcus ruber]MDI9970655.1 TetR family transcriptional regulator [Rhodococcus ruber]
MVDESIRVSFRRHLREEAIRAAQVLTVEKGWERVRISEVAALIGVSRPTLYKEFGDKQGLGDALVLQEAERFLLGITAVLDAHRGAVEEAIPAAVRYTLDEAAASPLLRVVLTAPSADTPREETGVLPLLTTSASMLELTSERLEAWLVEHFPQIDGEVVADCVDALIRLTISYLVLPTTGSAETGRRITRVALRCLGFAGSAGGAALGATSAAARRG